MALLISSALIVLLFSLTGTELFPKTDTGQAQVRLRLPVGTRLERTEDATRKLLWLINDIAGKDKVDITSAFVGTQPSSFPVNYIHLWTSGPHEAITRIKLKPDALGIDAFKEQLRDAVKKQIPNAKISFEPGDLSEQVLNLLAGLQSFCLFLVIVDWLKQYFLHRPKKAGAIYLLSTYAKQISFIPYRPCYGLSNGITQQKI